MANKLTKAQIETAADWWAGVISRPKFDNGGDGFATMLAMGLAQRVTDEQRAIFREELIKILGEADGYILLSCDYHPGHFLAEAMAKADIPATNAPWKTDMSFRDGKVQVSYGYGEPWKEVPLKG